MSEVDEVGAATSWSSTLSVAEMAAVHEVGLSPLGLVLGSSVYKIGIDYSPNEYYQYMYGSGGLGGGLNGGGWNGGGWNGGGMGAGQRGNGPWAGGGRGAGWGGGAGGGWSGGTGRSGFPGWTKYYNGGNGWSGSPLGLGGNYAVAVCWERTVLESGVEAAAALAMGRMTDETVRLGAHGVVGTRLNFRWVEGLSSTLEFTAMGTAVVRPGAAPLAHPFTSHLDGQALLKLIRAGMVPVAVSVGSGAVTASIPSLSMAGTTEIAPFGDAIEASRRIAGERLARNAGGRGWAVLGTNASVSMEGEAAGRTMTTVLTGTAVRRFAKGHWDQLPSPIMRLSRP